MTIIRSELEPTKFKKAWDEWAESKDGRSCLNGSSIKLPMNQEPYFHNRMFLAFSAGYNAGEVKP